MKSGRGETSLLAGEEKGKFCRESRERTQTPCFARESAAIVAVSQGFLCVLEDKGVNQKV